MKKSEQHLDRMSKARSRSVTAVLTFAVVLMVVATPSAQAQTLTLLHSFQGPPLDGWSPNGELIFDSAGNLYGTTIFGGSGTGYGATGVGTVFEVDASGKETIQYSFSGTAGGEFPTGRIVRYGGNIYGTTSGGGAGTGCFYQSPCGTVFELSRGQETVVHTFSGPDGGLPLEGLTRDTSGNLFGTTLEGGVGCSVYGCGTVFEISQAQQATIYIFGGAPDGASPQGTLIVDKLGNLYGTASGGAFGEGTVFELSPNSDGTWTERLLYSFRGKSDGAVPAGLVMDAKGNLYGTTEAGGLNMKSGTACQGGCGVVFKLKKDLDGIWTERVLHKFAGPPADGQRPVGNLVRDKQGNLYGVTYEGGSSGKGILFEVDATGQETLLHTFTDAPTDGANPQAGLTIDSSGNLYGTTSAGGGAARCAGGCGTAFKITP